MAGGLAVAGARPVVLIYSTFLQRAYDSIMHDVCLQPHCPVIFAIDRGGLVGDDGPSHHGVFDIAYLRHLPGMVLMAPRDDEELDMMFRWSLEQGHPVAIRYPRGNVPEFQFSAPRPPLDPGVPEMVKKGAKVALCAYGGMLPEALEADVLLGQAGLDVAVYNLRFAKPLKAESYAEIFEAYDLVVTIEDHVLMGGIGSAILEMASEHGLEMSKVLRIGIPDAFVAFMSRPEQLAALGLDGSGIAKKVLERMGGSLPQNS
jgi:1-deoxy-D-xylulose-5-phosphate synthase